MRLKSENNTWSWPAPRAIYKGLYLPIYGSLNSAQHNKGLVTNYGEGGATKREGGAREVLPLRKGGAEKVLAILKGGHKKFWDRFYAVA